MSVEACPSWIPGWYLMEQMVYAVDQMVYDGMRLVLDRVETV
jgi:hypothetical protein